MTKKGVAGLSDAKKREKEGEGWDRTVEESGGARWVM